MALTKPKLSQVTFSGIPDFPVSFPDTLIELNNNGTVANLDIGFVFNRTLGNTASNVALYWNESTQSFVTAYTNSSGNTDSNVEPITYANITSGVVTANTIYTTTGIFFANGAPAGGSPGGVNGSVQFNDNQTLNGSNISYNKNNGNLTISSLTNSTSKTTGAVVIEGGLGVGGDVYATHVFADGLFWAGNGQVIQTGGGGGGGQMSMDWGLITDGPSLSTTYDFGLLDTSGYSVTTILISEFIPAFDGDLMNGSDEIDLLEPSTATVVYDLA